jgi:hypothetical protein
MTTWLALHGSEQHDEQDGPNEPNFETDPTTWEALFANALENNEIDEYANDIPYDIVRIYIFETIKDYIKE